MWFTALWWVVINYVCVINDLLRCCLAETESQCSMYLYPFHFTHLPVTSGHPNDDDHWRWLCWGCCATDGITPFQRISCRQWFSWPQRTQSSAEIYRANPAPIVAYAYSQKLGRSEPRQAQGGPVVICHWIWCYRHHCLCMGVWPPWSGQRGKSAAPEIARQVNCSSGHCNPVGNILSYE